MSLTEDECRHMGVETARQPMQFKLDHLVVDQGIRFKYVIPVDIGATVNSVSKCPLITVECDAGHPRVCRHSNVQRGFGNGWGFFSGIGGVCTCAHTLRTYYSGVDEYVWVFQMQSIDIERPSSEDIRHRLNIYEALMGQVLVESAPDVCSVRGTTSLDRNVVNKYGLYLLLGVITVNLVDYVYIYTVFNCVDTVVLYVVYCILSIPTITHLSTLYPMGPGLGMASFIDPSTFSLPICVCPEIHCFCLEDLISVFST